MSSSLDLKPPKMKLSDIIKEQKENIGGGKNETISTTKNNSLSTTLGDPSLILGDWLYLGNRYHAKSKELLQKLEITHVLNITATIPNSFSDIIQYAQIKVFDESTVKLYDYFEAAETYIDLCNPLNYDINNVEKKRKILVHCAMGISRSATITISYLMSRPVLLNNQEKKILTHIQNKLEEYDKEIETKINENNYNGNGGWSPKIFQDHRNNKDWTQRKRKKYRKISQHTTDTTDDEKTLSPTNNMNNNDEICNGLTLGEAYLYVLERRRCICPNVGFCRQLELWEKFVWDSNDTTVYQIPFFRPDLGDDNNGNKKKQKNGKNQDEESNHNIQCQSQCCIIL